MVIRGDGLGPVAGVAHVNHTRIDPPGLGVRSPDEVDLRERVQGPVRGCPLKAGLGRQTFLGAGDDAAAGVSDLAVDEPQEQAVFGSGEVVIEDPPQPFQEQLYVGVATGGIDCECFRGNRIPVGASGILTGRSGLEAPR